MSELFDEVDEEVRREQLKKLWDKYSIFIIAAVVLIVAAVGGWRGYQYLEAKKAAEAGAAFEKAAELSEQNKHAEAEAAFTELAAKAPSGYRMLARLRAAAEVGDPRSQGGRQDCMTTSPPIAASAASEQDLAKIRAARLAAGQRQLCRHAAAAGARHRAGRPSAIPRASCWRCRPGAPTT